MARAPFPKKKFAILETFATRAFHPANANMELLPAHQPLLEDDTDEDMSDEQIRELLNEAATRMRAKAAGKPTATPDAPFRLPKLRPGHLADTYEKTDGSITRLDHSKLIDKKQQALANGIKKIEDPLAVKKQKIEVRANTIRSLLSFAVDDNYPNFILSRHGVPSWVLSCKNDALLSS
jgi:hypothetical protein